MHQHTIITHRLCLAAMLVLGCAEQGHGAACVVYGHVEDFDPAMVTPADSDSTAKVATAALDSTAKVDSAALTKAMRRPERRRRNWSTWRPETKRAMWLALAIPGAGQIYNRKYWKLPIIYGGFVGCAYALRWNNMMFHDYSQAYIDIMDDDPRTESYNQFLHLGTTINESNKERWQEVFRKRKDMYRRWRDLSLFVMIGVYALSVIDAYVDASLSEFDISPDLSLHVTPAVISTGNGMSGRAIGLQCSFDF